MAGAKPKWEFWTFWLTVSAALIAAGVALPSVEYATVSKSLISVLSKALISAGVAVLILSLLSLALAPLTRPLSVLPSVIVQFVKRSGAALLSAYARVGAFVLKPILARAEINEPITPEGVPAGPVSSWTAHRNLGPQKSDLLPISMPGHVVSNVHFVVRPDYRFRNWYAGFRLAPSGDEVWKTELTTTVLFYLVDNPQMPQPTFHLYVQRRAQGPFALRNFGQPRPSFEFDIAVYPAGAGELCAAISVDKEWVQAMTFPQRYAEQLVLVAFADGRDFKIQFDNISVSWAPIE
jgi:hypothetical protein